MANAYPINPLYLLGGYFDFSESMPDGYSDERYSALVVAVQVPLPGSSIEWQLLLQRFDLSPECSSLEYVSLDTLKFDWPEFAGPSDLGAHKAPIHL